MKRKRQDEGEIIIEWVNETKEDGWRGNKKKREWRKLEKMVEGGEWRKLEKMDEGEIRKERVKETREDGWRGNKKRENEGS